MTALHLRLDDDYRWSWWEKGYVALGWASMTAPPPRWRSSASGDDDDDDDDDDRAAAASSRDRADDDVTLVWRTTHPEHPRVRWRLYDPSERRALRRRRRRRSRASGSVGSQRKSCSVQ